MDTTSNGNMKHKCRECGHDFSTIYSLKRHVGKFHPDKKETYPLRYKNSENFNFTCALCSKNFSYEHNLKSHIKTHIWNTETFGSSEEAAVSPNSKKCPLCSYHTSSTKDLFTHFNNEHQITVHSKEITFESFEDFVEWKNDLENKQSVKFVRNKKCNFKHHIALHYACHRSGNYVPGGKNLRHLKTQGSAKINAYCPSNIRLIKKNNGECIAKFIPTHVGHQMEIGHLTLTESQRRDIAAKIAAKIPFDDILDEVRDSIVDSDLKRIHLLNKRDLYNIASSFNLNAESVRHSNDAVSVDSWVTEMKKEGNTVLFYKPQGTLSEEYPDLKEEDFVLILMTPAQLKLFKKFSLDCVCLDGTHGLNSYNFELFTILVLDELREGFPCGFLISNRGDKEVFKLFFTKIRELSNIVAPKVFMSDLAEGFYNAWIEIMGIPEKRLFCTWHVDRAWRKNLSKIKSKERQVSVYKQLRVLLEETDANAFNKMITEFCSSTDSEIIDFVAYFRNYYLKNTEQWAYCHRLNAGINTNMHLESMHKTIKYIYLKGKRIKRLDKSIGAIMRFVRDKLIDQLIAVNKGKISSKVKNIRSRHKNMEKWNIDHSLIIETEHGWKVPSENNIDIYSIQEVKAHCVCRLICPQCEICLHQYVCTCIDASIKYNMCKHIHLVAMFRKELRKVADVNISNNPLADEISEAHLSISQLTNKNYDFVKEKEEVRDKFLLTLATIKTPAELKIVKKVIAPLSPTLAAARRPLFAAAAKVGESGAKNRKITPQRRLFSTKKTKKQHKHPIAQKPNSTESVNISIGLLSHT